MHEISSYRGNRHRPPATDTQTHRHDRLQYTAPLASAQCKNTVNHTDAARISMAAIRIRAHNGARPLGVNKRRKFANKTVRFKIPNRHTGRSDGSRVRYCHLNFLENYRRNSSRIHFDALRPTYFFSAGLISATTLGLGIQ